MARTCLIARQERRKKIYDKVQENTRGVESKR